MILKKTLTWENLDNYLRTWSPLVAFKDAHPDDAKNPQGDIVQRFVKRLQKGVAEDLGADYKPSDEVELEFPVALLLLKKRAT